MADEVKIIRLVIDSSKAVDGSAAATRALENMERSLGSVDTMLQRMDKSLSQAATILKAQLITLLYDAASRFTAWAKSMFEAVSGLDELAEQLGITSSGLQALQFQAVQGGVKIEQLEGAVGKFSQKIGEAAGGSKAMIDALNNLGVKILDVNGNLRPTEKLMQEVAARIMAIEDPAKRAAAAVDFFGKTGAKMLTMMPEIAKGFDVMGESARRAGAMISAEAIAKLDKLADSGAKASLVTRAMFAEVAAGPLIQVIDTVTKKIQQLSTVIQDAASDLLGLLSTAANPALALTRLFSSTTAEKTEAGMQRSNDRLATLMDERAQHTDPTVTAEYDRLIARERERFAGYQRQQHVANVGGKREQAPGMDPDGMHVVITPKKRTGDQNPTPTGGGGGGETPEDKYKKLMTQLGLTAAAQREMTAAARDGDVAFEEQKASLDAQQKMLEIFGAKAGYTTEQLDELRKKLLEIAQGKTAEAFNVGTTELGKQNELLEAQIRLMNELPEVQAREIALIKSKQEAQKGGAAIDADMVESRRAAIEQNERLKTQAEELKKAQELWTEPLKQALRDIQSTGADAFEKMLESGTISFESLKETFSKIIRRMAAEFLALATIRPVMSVLVNAISPSMAQSMGLGSSGGGSSMFGGGGLSSLGGGGGSGLLGNIGGFLNSPIFGSGYGSYNTAADIASLTGGSMGNIQPNSFLSGLGGTTWMQGLGAAAGIGMGAYQLLSGNGSASSTIGGISSMVGGAVSLIPGVGQIAGPIIAMLGNILPGMLGLDKPPLITNQEYGQLAYGANGFGTSGGAWGPSADAGNLQGPLGQMGSSMQSIFDGLGGVKDPSKVWGVALQSMAQSQGNWNFSNQTSFLVDPNGNRRQWGQGSNAQDIGMEAAGVAATFESLMAGAVGQITENLKKGIATVNTDGHGTFAQLATVVAEIKTFDDAIEGLGKTMVDAEKAILAIDQSFAGMYATAEKYGLSVTDVDTAKAKARLGVATDFGKSISRGILEMTDPKAAALQDLDDWRTAMADNNKWLIENVTGALDQINEIERLYGMRRVAIVEQTTASALGGLKSTIDRLLYGDMSGASPGDMLSGTKGTYLADLAKAFTGDSAAAGRLNSSSADYMQAAASYYGTASAEYQGIRKQSIIDLASAYRYQGGQFGDIPGGYDVIMGGGGFTGLPGMGAANLNIGLATVSGQMAENTAESTALQKKVSDLTVQVADLTAQVQTLILKLAAAA